MSVEPAASKAAKRKAAQSGTVSKRASRGGAAAKTTWDSSSTSATVGRSTTQKAPAGAGTTKISVTVPTELLAEVRSLGPDNLSAVVADALRHWSAKARLGRMLDELDAIHGPVPPDVAAEVEAEWGQIFDRSEARSMRGPKG